MLEEEIDLNSPGSLNDAIAVLEDNMPDKRTKDYKTWKETINALIDKYNEVTNHKLFKKYE